jgi:uncharacterized protein (TIGR01777 family)
MNILITGATGLIGTALSSALEANGHTVYPLVREENSTAPFHWLPSNNKIQLDDSITLDAVIHLAGANIADKRWDEQRKNDILNSREIPTKLLADTLAQMSNKPAVFISGSAIGFYGETGDNTVDENSPQGTGFLSEVAGRWEQATQSAEKAGIRTVHIRTGVVLSTHGGMLKQMMLPFKLGLGGIIGDGKQYLSYVAIDEVTTMIEFLLENSAINGAINLVSRKPVTNAEFTRALGKALHRPTLFPLPSFIARLMFGEMADALLLSSARVLPTRLVESGYKFKDNDLVTTLHSLMDENR